MSPNRNLSRKLLLAICALVTVLLGSGFQQPSVRVEPADSVGPRTLEKQTQTAVIRDYLQAWQCLSDALRQNRAELVDASFVGVAQQKLTGTIREQKQLGIHTVYQDRSHDINLVFYSPDGLSIELLDTVEYEVQIRDGEKLQGKQNIRSRYLAVLTPTEVRWKVRVLQAEPKQENASDSRETSWRGQHSAAGLHPISSAAGSH